MALEALFAKPGTIPNSSVEVTLVTSGANDTDGTLKVKVVLKSTSGTTTNYYKQ
ncbi:lipoprotein 17-related variable surface protein, partial [Mycoplasmopsis agassizii]|uniref:lipoprotein 17-related variable surface protein n=1 Tax=Mycoplasmopsis agassizii TaxID=33922 RepID=UPI0009D8FED8